MGNVTLNLKLRPTPLPPMTANGYLVDVEGVAAIIFQNTGDSTCRIFDGMWTVLPNGGVLALNVTEHVGSIDLLNLQITFTGGTTNRLEILTMRQGKDNTTLNC